MQTFRDVSCLFGMFWPVFWSCFYQPTREPGELVLKRWSSFATTLYTEDLLNIACCLKHLEWHLIVSPLMIHCIAIQTHSFKRLYCNHSIVKPAMFINEGIRDAGSTVDISDGSSRMLTQDNDNDDMSYLTGDVCAWNCKYLRLCIFRFSCFAILSTNGDINPTHKTKALHSPLCFQVNCLSASSGLTN